MVSVGLKDSKEIWAGIDIATRGEKEKEWWLTPFPVSFLDGLSPAEKFLEYREKQE